MTTGAPQTTFLASIAAHQPQVDDPSRRGLASAIVNLVFLAIATSVGLFRLYSRGFVTKTFGSDDLFIIFALVSLPPVAALPVY
jgi:ABC-type Na+ efflux pump permease subunit